MGKLTEAQRVDLIDKEIAERQNSYSFLVLWHELCHAIYDQHLLEAAKEEIVVNAYSHGFTMILRDNPDLKNWMQQCLK